ncbi:MAG: hypothetical protein ACM3KR_00630 [Deltaproteobacteria bacterium]
MAKNQSKDQVWDMSTKQAREIQVKRDFGIAKDAKMPITLQLIQLDEYYNNRHYTKDQIINLAAEKGWDFVPPVLPDPFILVETGIDPLRPEFTFKGRDNKITEDKIKERQDVVEFILYNNKIDDMMPENERNLSKSKNAFWKVAFDDKLQGPGYIGDITIGNPNPANIFPDPSAYDIDDCEYIIYAYRMHRRQARRVFGEIVDTVPNDNNHSDTEIYGGRVEITTSGSITSNNGSQLYLDNSLQVIEYWYKDDEGDIACSIQINETEVKHIPKYWKNTASSGNKMYPFVKYCKIPMQQSFWDKSEIETIIDLVDAADREFITAILSDDLSTGDIILVEENALANGQTIKNIPNQVVTVKQNKMGSVRRLGDISNNNNALNMIQFIHDKIQETNGSFDSSQGKEPTRVTTASGIAQLNEKAGKRSELKKADRNTGFRRLFELCDWTALEFYTNDRLIMIRGKNNEPDIPLQFNANNHKEFNGNQYMVQMEDAAQRGIEVTPEMEEQFADQASYFPRIDAEIIVSDGVIKSKAFTAQATSEVLAQMDNLNPAKAEVLKSQVETMGLPNQEAIEEGIDMTIQQQAEQGQGMQEQQREHPVDTLFKVLSPEQQQQFLKLSREEQIAMINQIVGGNI